MASAVSGVAGEGFRTTLHPAARAGAILRVTIVAGKFQGVTAATAPTGCRSTQVRLPACGDGTHSPVTRRACSANHPKYPRAKLDLLARLLQRLAVFGGDGAGREGPRPPPQSPGPAGPPCPLS